MPALLEDPTAPAIYRTSGSLPYPQPNDPEVPTDITPRQVTLRDRITTATLLPFVTATSVPPRLLAYLCSQFNLEIDKGDTYPMVLPMPLESFATYWFQNFGAIMVMGSIEEEGYVQKVWEMENEGVKWEEMALGSFYVKPNYPGRSSHVCNGGFLVTEAARNKGVGRLMGEGYIEWAPKLGYNYSVFNLVYETNVASCRIWDALGFKRVGRIKGCGNLRSSPNEYVDAIIYGRELGPEAEDYVTGERFDKIRFYLKHGKYPNGADRAEKSRLRSAATHYKLLPPEPGREAEEDAERLMLRDKEVISNPQRQYEIARQIHIEGQHGGINKTTATIAEKFHWTRIKETVSLVIKNCEHCKDNANKVPPQTQSGSRRTETKTRPGSSGVDTAMIDRLISFDNRSQSQEGRDQRPDPETQHQVTSPAPTESSKAQAAPLTGPAPIAHMGYAELSQYSGIPLDPQIVQQTSHLQQQQTRQRQRQRQQQQNQAYHATPPTQPQMGSVAEFGHHHQQGVQRASASHSYPDSLYADLQAQAQAHAHAVAHANPHKLPDGSASTRLPEGPSTRDFTEQASASGSGGKARGTNARRPTRSSAAAAAAASAAAQAQAAAAAMAVAKNGGPSSQSHGGHGLRHGGNGHGLVGGGDDNVVGQDRYDHDIDMVDASSDPISHQAQAHAHAQAQAASHLGLGSGDVGGGSLMSSSRDDTRLATDRHIRMGDDPMGTR